MRFRTVLLYASFLLGVNPVQAADHVWIVGGGPNLGSSQAQIELNVNWVIQVLNSSPGTRQLHIYYTDGNAPGKDVVLWQPPKESRNTLQPLARVLGNTNDNGESYHSHQIPHVIGGTEVSTLKPSLEKEFSALKPGDRSLLIYNGHGLPDSRDVAGNTLRLWNNTRLSVRELDQIMNRIDPGVPVRFIFTQCFSGGFERLVHPRARDTLELGEANRCGFFAESEDREAEGCSASIKIGDYRDYSTFFFAALQGRMRTGELIEVNPDRDGDGVVSLHEAHLFALAQGQNADLPRSTSEVFLERWQPWYLRWVDTGAVPDNVYGKIAREVARRNGLPESGQTLVHEMRGRRQALATAMDNVLNEQAGLDKEIGALRSAIRKDVAAHWPEALSPYTLNFANFLRKDLAAAQDFIVAHPRYAELVTKQNRHAALDEEVLHVDRDITQLDKILRLRTLARLQSQFERHATAREREWYGRLMSCEGQGL